MYLRSADVLRELHRFQQETMWHMGILCLSNVFSHRSCKENFICIFWAVIRHLQPSAIKKEKKKKEEIAQVWWRLDIAAGVFSDSCRVFDRIPLKVKFGDAGVTNGVSLRFLVTLFAAGVRWAWSRWVLLMIILAGQNTICQFPVRRGSNFPPDCTLVMTYTAAIQAASELRLDAAVETWSPCCRGGKEGFSFFFFFFWTFMLKNTVRKEKKIASTTSTTTTKKLLSFPFHPLSRR